MRAWLTVIGLRSGDGMTTQRDHLPEVGRTAGALVIPESACPARTLLIFRAVLPVDEVTAGCLGGR
ncbi:hypothetical protein GCM10027445_27040 [Amycolatopsis endophytica]